MVISQVEQFFFVVWYKIVFNCISICCGVIVFGVFVNIIFQMQYYVDIVVFCGSIVGIEIVCWEVCIGENCKFNVVYYIVIQGKCLVGW